MAEVLSKLLLTEPLPEKVGGLVLKSMPALLPNTQTAFCFLQNNPVVKL